MLNSCFSPSCFNSFLWISKNFKLSLAIAMMARSACHFFKSNFQSMIVIFDISNPFKIIKSVVAFDAIFMVYLRFILWVWNIKITQTSVKVKLSHFSFFRAIKDNISSPIFYCFYLFFASKNRSIFIDTIIRKIINAFHFIVLIAKIKGVNGQKN